MYRAYKIFDKKKLVSIIFKKTNKKIKKQINFFTNDRLPFQVGLFNHPENHKIIPHQHKKKVNKIKQKSEFLFLLSGKIRVNFFNKDKIKINSKIMKTGDMILLLDGGHGFDILKKTILVEVKQGPFNSKNDKIRFKEKSDN